MKKCLRVKKIKKKELQKAALKIIILLSDY